MPPIRPCNLSTGSCRGGFFAKKQVFSDKYRGKIALREAVYFPSVLPLPESKGGDRNRTTIIRQQTSDSRIRMANIGRQTIGRQTSDSRNRTTEITSAGRFPPRGCTKAYVSPCDIAVRCMWFSAAAHGDMYRFAVKLFRLRGRLLSSPSPRPGKTGGQPFLSVPGDLQAPDRKQATPSRLPKRP